MTIASIGIQSIHAGTATSLKNPPPPSEAQNDDKVAAIAPPQPGTGQIVDKTA
jgi:hypothetical protein